MNNELRNHFVSYDCPFVEGDVYGLKKDFSLKAPLRSARLLLSGLGMYDAYLNGKKGGGADVQTRLHLLQETRLVPRI